MKKINVLISIAVAFISAISIGYLFYHEAMRWNISLVQDIHFWITTILTLFIFVPMILLYVIIPLIFKILHHLKLLPISNSLNLSVIKIRRDFLVFGGFAFLWLIALSISFFFVVERLVGGIGIIPG